MVSRAPIDSSRAEMRGTHTGKISVYVLVPLSPSHSPAPPKRMAWATVLTEVVILSKGEPGEGHARTP